MTTLLHLPFDVEDGVPLVYDHGAAKVGFVPTAYDNTGYYIRVEDGIGKYGAAAHLNAGWLTGGYQSWMDLQGDWTFEGWINSTFANQSMILMCRWADGNGPWRFGLGSDGHLWFDYIDASGTTNPTSGTSTIFVQKNTWAHFAFVRASGVMSVYVNGALSFTQNVASIKIYTPTNLNIGRNEQSNVWHYYGYMDDFRFSDVALYIAAFTPPAKIDYTPLSAFGGGPTNRIATKSYYPWPKVNLSSVGKLAGVSERLSDAYYGGNGTIEGHTYVLTNGASVPAARRVRLFVQPHGGAVAETWSDATGHYAFKRLSKAYKYFVMSFDHTGANEAVVGTNITPV